MPGGILFEPIAVEWRCCGNRLKGRICLFCKTFFLFLFRRFIVNRDRQQIGQDQITGIFLPGFIINGWGFRIRVDDAVNNGIRQRSNDCNRPMCMGLDVADL